MGISRVLFVALAGAVLFTIPVHAEWMDFTGGPTVVIGNWPAGSNLSGTATVTRSAAVNGNLSTPDIGLTPNTIGPPLSTDYFATGLVPNPGNTVPVISTPYNDAADTYHVVIDFSGTTGGSVPGVLPAGSIFALVDLDIEEDFRRINATNALSLPIATAWIAGPNGYFDATPPMIPQSSLIPNPTLTGPVAGIYDAFGVSYNFDVGMWLFQTTQDVRTISFDMSKSTGGNAIGGGGAAWGFYSAVPEPSAAFLLCGALLLLGRTRK